MKAPVISHQPETNVHGRVSRLPWAEIRTSLWNLGFGQLGVVLNQSECEHLRSLYVNAALFRSRIDMARFRFGRGEYQYFAYPLPELVASLRDALYGALF